MATELLRIKLLASATLAIISIIIIIIIIIIFDSFIPQVRGVHPARDYLPDNVVFLSFSVYCV